MALAPRTPTVTAAEKFNADYDATQLNEAFKGVGTNENVIISILAGRSREQRQSIQEAWKERYHKDLLDNFRSESGNFLFAIEGLFLDPPDFHAKYIKTTLSTYVSLPGKVVIALLEVLYPLSRVEIDVVSRAYFALFRIPLLKDVGAKVKGPFAATVVALLKVGKELESVPTTDKMQKDVDFLVNLPPEQWTPENNQLMDLLIKNNFYLFSVLSHFNKITGRDILDIACTQPLPEFREGFKTIVGSAQDQWKYFADQLYMSMEEIGTNNTKLIYIIIFRCEMDLGNIENVFLEKYSFSLHNLIRDKITGGSRNLMIALAGLEA